MLANVACNFRKEIKPYEHFTMKTELVSWTEKWVYVCTRFYGRDEQDLRAHCLAQYVFKRGRKTIAPIEGKPYIHHPLISALTACGYQVTPEIEAINANNLKTASLLHGLKDLVNS